MKAALADAHCHVGQLPDPGEEIEAAGRLGVRRMLSCSEDLTSMDQTLGLARRFSGTIVPGLGLHPAIVMHQDDETVAAGLSFLRTHLHEAAFVGEVGLDYLHAAAPSQRERQREILMEQIALAAAAHLPVCLHSRRAERDALQIAATCSEDWGIPALLHWFTHSARLVRAACRAPGVYMSAGPAVLYDPAAMTVATSIAPDRLLVETDTPVPFDGQSTTPSWIPRVVHALAAARGMRVDELVALLDENLDRFLYWPRTVPHQTQLRGETRDAPAAT